MSLVVALVLSVDGLRAMRAREDELRRELAERAELLATVQAESLAAALWDFDEEKALALFAALAVDPDLAHARLYDPDGHPKWHRGRRPPTGRDLRIVRSVLARHADHPVKLAELELFVSTERVEAALREKVLHRLSLLACTLAAVLGTIAFGLRRLGRPLEAIAGTVVRLARGEHGLVIPGRERPDEIGAVARAMESLRLTVEEAERSRSDEARAAHLALARIRAAVESVREPIAILEPGGTPAYLNPAAERLLGSSGPAALRPTGLLQLIGDRAARHGLVRALRTGRAFASELEIRPGGRTVTVELRIDRIEGPDGTLAGFVAIASDVSERRAAEARIRRLAHFDPLTDLPNRAAFGERLEKAVIGALERGARLALLFVDLDRFKEINDSLGHPTGDALLCAVAGRMRNLLPAGAFLARLGGDEFALLLERIDDARSAAGLAARIVSALGEPFALNGRTVRSGATIGVALLPDHADSPEQLLRDADLALYRAKAEGRGRIRFFDPEIARALHEAQELEGLLHEALDRDWFRLHYQPRFAIAPRRLVGAEALLRLEHPRQGLIPPGRFVQLAEERGLIVPIGARVIEEAVAQAARWSSSVPSPPSLSVNLSPVQLHEEDVVERLAMALERHRLPPGLLEVEITEGVLMADTPSITRTLERIRGLGVGVALDDFGTGYASLSYLRRFPLDRLKLDRSFVSDLEADACARAVARTVIELGHALGMRVTAEGVETEGQLACLRSLGCDEAQGFLLGRPMEPERLTATLESEPRPSRRRSRTRAAVAARARRAACAAERAPA